MARRHTMLKDHRTMMYVEDLYTDLMGEEEEEPTIGEMIDLDEISIPAVEKTTDGNEGNEEDLEENMQRFEKEIEAMELEEERKEFDFSLLNCHRRPNQLGKDSKIGELLQGTLKETTAKRETNGMPTEKSEMDTSTEALLNYFVLLGQTTDDMDLGYLDNLCKAGDVNVKDCYGQTIMHEVAREWSADVGNFLLFHGVKVDLEDDWGRTPLFVAVACNSIEMINWLVENGADIQHRTMIGDEQCPIHYAAKYDAVQAFEQLVTLGADPLMRDRQARTPFFLAAEAGRTQICGYMLDQEFPVVSYDDTAACTIDHIVANLPTQLAWKALDQFVTICDVTNTAKLYLSCLGKRRRKLVTNVKNVIVDMPPTPVEVIIRRGDLDLIKHPVILECLKLKAEYFGNSRIQLDIFACFLLTLLWTLSVSFRNNDLGNVHLHDKGKFYSSIIFAVISQVVTCWFIYKLYRTSKAYKLAETREKRRLRKAVTNMKQYCHPRWGHDYTMLQVKEEAAENVKLGFWSDTWIRLEAFCLGIATIYFILVILWVICHWLDVGSSIRDIRMIYSAVFVIILWFRLNRCLNATIMFGTLIPILMQCFAAGAQILFLFIEFYVPFCVAFWVIHGGEEDADAKDSEYQKFNDLMYQVWLMTFIGDYEYTPFANDIVVKVLLSIYFVLVSIITLNIYIALLSETVSRVGINGLESAHLEKAKRILESEMEHPELKRKFEIYLDKYCAPKIMDRAEYRHRYKNSGLEENPWSVIRQVSAEISGVNATIHKLASSEESTRSEMSALVTQITEIDSGIDPNKSRDILEKIQYVISKYEGNVLSFRKR